MIKDIRYVERKRLVHTDKDGGQMFIGEGKVLQKLVPVYLESPEITDYQWIDVETVTEEKR